MRRTATFLLALATSVAGIVHAAPPMQTVKRWT
jgi:apolipoprotein D and lipocalin family protein